MQSIGERLEEARKRKGITVREAAEATKIRGDYINSFESNSFKINIPDIYIRGFLRSYSNYLKLNSDKIITDYNAHLLGEGKSQRRENREFLGRLELQQQPSEPEAHIAGAISDEENERDESAGNATTIWEKLNLEKDVALKIGIAVALSFAVLLVIIWGVMAFIGSEEPSVDSPLAETPATVAPAADATPFTLIANDDVRVEVKQIDGDRTIFFEVVPQGEQRELRASGSIRISYSDAAALSIRIGTNTYQMHEDRDSIRITPSKILQGQQAGN